MNLSLVKVAFTIATSVVMMFASLYATYFQVKASKATIASEQFAINRLAALTGKK